MSHISCVCAQKQYVIFRPLIDRVHLSFMYGVFQVYGTKGTAIIEEPFEPGNSVKLWLDADRGEYQSTG